MMKKSVTILVSLISILLGCLVFKASAVSLDPIPYTFTWKTLSGTAVFKKDNVAIRQGGTLVVSDQVVPNGSTIALDVISVWSAPGQIVFLYVDQLNYYTMNLQGNRGVYRVIDGMVTKLNPNVDFPINTYDFFFANPHAGASKLRYGIYTFNDGSKINIKIDKYGDGSYELDMVDDNQAAVARFSSGGLIGAKDPGTIDGMPRFSFENIKIYQALYLNEIKDYYVDSAIGDDTNDGSQKSPLKTIAKAASLVTAGATVYLAPGIYRESNIKIKNSGTKDSPITFKALDPNNKPVLVGSESAPLSQWSLYKDGIYKTTLNWKPTELYNDNFRFFRAQYPNQKNSYDQYDTNDFVLVKMDQNPQAAPINTLIDSEIFTQVDSDYYNGASLIYFSGYMNTTRETKITGFIPEEHRITFTDTQDKSLKSKFALVNSINFIDQESEWAVVENADGTFTVYVKPLAGMSLDEIAFIRQSTSFVFGDVASIVDYIVFDSLEIKHYSKSGLILQRGFLGSARYTTINNCEIHDNLDNGVLIYNQADKATIKNSKIYHNGNNGICIICGKYYLIENNDIYQNLVNGIWAGSGGQTPYFVEDLVIRKNHIHDQSAKRLHPDNMQFAQVNNVLIDGNLLEQNGYQNMWAQYNGKFTIINNIVKGGAMGINSAKEAYIYNNVFDNSVLRFDAWPSTNPNYQNDKIVIRNNIFIETAFSLPPENTWETAGYPGVFIDYNLYSITNAFKITTWKNFFKLENSIFDPSPESVLDYVQDRITYEPTDALIDKGANFNIGRDLTDYLGNERFQGSSIDIGVVESMGSFNRSGYDPVPELYIPDLPPTTDSNVYFDNFDNRFNGVADLTTAKTTNGLSWNLVYGNASIISSNASKFLILPKVIIGSNKSLLVTNQGSDFGDYSLSFDFKKAWSPSTSGIVLSYVDSDNFYWFNPRKGQLLKRFNGIDILLGTNSTIALTHSENTFVSYRIFSAIINGERKFSISKSAQTAVLFSDSSSPYSTATLGLIKDNETDLQISIDNIVLTKVIIPSIVGGKRSTIPTQVIPVDLLAPTAITPPILSIQEGFSANITLAGTDPQNKPLNYIVIKQPRNGTLTGTAPNLVYKANYGVTSVDDIFYFKVNNGTLDSTFAATVEMSIIPDKLGETDKVMVLNLKDFSSIPVDGNVNPITVKESLNNNLDGFTKLAIYARAKVNIDADEGQATNYANIIVNKYLSYQLCTRSVVSQTVQATIYNQSGESVLLTAKKIDLTVWHDYLLKYDGVNAELYVDNVLVASNPFSGSVANTTQDVIIGKTPWNNNFRGLIEETKIFSDFVGFI